MTAEPQAPPPVEAVGGSPPRTRLYVALLAYVAPVLGLLATWWDVSGWVPSG